MAEMMYCPNCKRNVDVSVWTAGRIIILIILLILGILLGVIYLVYVLTLTKKCPDCETPYRFLEAPRFGSSNNTGDVIYCTACGRENRSDARFCGGCGAEIKK
jgi:uncharacterized protein YbaR (Trm112 family)